MGDAMSNSFPAVSTATALPGQPPLPARWREEELNRETVKAYLDQFQRWLGEAFDNGLSAEQLLVARTAYIDQLLQRLWLHYGLSLIHISEPTRRLRGSRMPSSA